MSEHFPYSRASDAYGQIAASTDPRALEARILMKAAQKMETLAARLQQAEKINFQEVGETLEYNQKLWTLFIDDALNKDHPLPQNIKDNIASLGVFVFKRTKELLIHPKPEQFQALVEINRNIAGGLLKQTATGNTSPTEKHTATSSTI